MNEKEENEGERMTMNEKERKKIDEIVINKEYTS